MKPTLLILAAGMGSRFGGLKQIEPVGPNGETIVDYSVYDAIRTGFGKIIFVVRESFAEPFKKIFDPKFKDKIEVEYVFQELENLPRGYNLPKDRVKPWGTAHAILVTREFINEPFCALNADDFYGFNAFKAMANFLSRSNDPDVYAMVGYKLLNTLSDFGSVSRGVCTVDENNMLQKIVETTKIFKKDNKIVSVEPDGNENILTGNESVSMNMWGFQPSLFEKLEEKISIFLENHIHELKSEIFIPSVVFDIIQEGKARVKVLKADSPWFGVTYKEDTPRVIERINKLIEEGQYPKKLF
jgi:UTP-glucose-1-phosphate uridylyltransferase